MTEVINKQGNPLGYEPIGKLLVKFAIPAVTSMVVNAIYNIVDQIFIGQGVGTLGNAATTIAFPVVSIILALSTLIGAGGSAYAAIKLGERDEEQAERVLGNAFFVSIFIGILIMIGGLLFMEPLVTLFGATENTIGYAKDYTTYILLAAPFNVLGIVLSNFARTDGSPVLAMYSMVAGAVLNVILDPIFIFVLKWGVMGAAVATAISQVVSALILIRYFMGKSRMKLTKEGMKFRISVIKSITSLGISSCVLHFATTFLNIILNNMLVTYGNMSHVGGDTALSAMGVVLKISMIIISVCIGIGVGSQPILGFNRGAKRYDRVRKTYLIAVSIGFAVTVIGWIMCQTIPHIVLKLFGDGDQNFTDFAVRCMKVYLGGLFAAGLQIVTTNYFQATGQPAKAAFMSLSRQVILLIPLLLILPRFFGLDGILYAGLFADLITGVVASCFALFELKKLGRLITETKTE